MWEAIRSMSLVMWLDSSTVWPRSAFSSTMAFRKSRRAAGSRLAAGSSSSSRSGLWPTASRIETFCWSPGESLSILRSASFHSRLRSSTSAWSQFVVVGADHGEAGIHPHPAEACEFLRHVAEPLADAGGRVPGIRTVQLRRAGARPHQSQRHAHESRLAAAVAAQESRDGARRQFKAGGVEYQIPGFVTRRDTVQRERRRGIGWSVHSSSQILLIRATSLLARQAKLLRRAGRVPARRRVDRARLRPRCPASETTIPMPGCRTTTPACSSMSNTPWTPSWGLCLVAWRWCARTAAGRPGSMRPLVMANRACWTIWR